jgi:hypothetical protein
MNNIIQSSLTIDLTCTSLTAIIDDIRQNQSIDEYAPYFIDVSLDKRLVYSIEIRRKKRRRTGS